MASILRSSKFVRYIAGFARHVVINTPREFDGNLVNTSQCLCSNIIPRTLTSQANTQHEQNLERSLRRLDQDVRRAGRISRRDIEDVLEEIRSSRSATSSQSLLVIRCCGNLVPEEMPEIRTKLVQEIWNTLHKLNVPMDISHYNALLRVYLENEHQFSPTEFLTELESKGIEPNRVTYQRLIARYCQLGDIEGATRILEFMREKQLPVNENVFNALITGHSQSGDMESAHGILSVMAQAGLEPSADTYTTLLCGYSKKGDINMINKLLEECETKEVYLLDKDYLDIAYALAINGYTEHVPVILSKVRKAFGYNQDAINVIYRLINKGQEDAAILVLRTMPRNTKPDGTLQHSGTFFIRQMVKAERPLEKIIEICDKFEAENLYDRALLLATEASLELTNEKLAYPLMKELQNRGQQIRQHFFWPLIIAKGDDPSGDGIIEVLLQMDEFNITPSSETLRDYVIPNLRGNSSEIIAKLRKGNVSLGSSACNLVYSLLQRNNIEEASVIISRVSAYYHPEMLRRTLSMAFYATNDLKSYMTILRYIHENLDRRDAVIQEEDSKTSTNNMEVVGQLICDLTHNGREFTEVIHNVLAALVEQGLSIDNDAARKIQDKLGEKLTPEISTLLGKLTSGELTPVPVVKRPPSYVPSDQMNIPQLERLIANLQAKGQEVLGLKRQLLTLCCRAKDLGKVEDLLGQLESTEFVFSAGVYSQLIDVYAYHDNLEKALYYYNKLKETNADFILDDSKLVRLVGLLIKNDQFEEGINMLNKQARGHKMDELPFAYLTQCWRLLNSLAEEGKTEQLDILFDTLVKNDFIEVNNVMLGPLIKVHFAKGDIDAALEKFEWCCNQFRATPWKNELACKLIQMEDADKLQKLTDLSTVVHGEINSLYDLVFAFVECGRIRQARKILETPGLQTRPQRINNACQRYQQEGMVKPLEGLKDATKDLNHIDRSDIYYQLLLSYIKQDDVDKALGLWTQMQEEDMAPTDKFLYKLGSFLTENGVEVPFVIPQPPEIKTETVTILKRPQQPVVKDVKTDLQLFRQAVKSGDLDAALNLKGNIQQDRISVVDMSNLIEQLVRKDRINEATKYTFELLDRSTHPIPRVFRYLLNKLTSTGDLQSLNAIGQRISTELKKILSFDNKVCHANMIMGNAAEYLDNLEKEIDNAKDEELIGIAEKFPRGGILGILEKHPEYISRYETIAFKYADRNIVAPINVLWSQYFIDGNHEKATTIWKKYLESSPRVMFQRVLQKARQDSNEDMTIKLIEQLKTSFVTPGALGNAYSCLLDILVTKEKDSDVIATFEKALKDVQLENLNRTALNRVQEVYVKLEKPFNYVIPAKSIHKNEVSSSDDEQGTYRNTEMK
ncbi:hypothetical protein ILUMI_11532 [Ignelater luminosus]|uniref:Leucine-rich PPR motif-containing protein, mitochondrial n=1 Tax=Ignelater luminosus TaxID=2038154 RepID=A0A8K0CY84_IGNLU|nr:hypothetical protein ILUMI_11532 [Ignelater luminosus]